MRKPQWRTGHRVELLENGEEFFPRVFEAIGAAHEEVLVETFICCEDVIGQQLRDTLMAAARRGVEVHLTVDGYGTPNLSPEFVDGMTAAGVRLYVFDPKPRILTIRTNPFRRLHRKLVVIDQKIAFVGGINFANDHMRAFGAQSKEDHAVEVEGPVVEDVRNVVVQTQAGRRGWWRRSAAATSRPSASAGSAEVALLVRDNRRHRNDIEHEYCRAIDLARHTVTIANAYFLPGFRLLRSLRNAARRGVNVRLILQGRYTDQPKLRYAAQTLYNYLLKEGIHIHEYRERPLHSKIAMIDGEWSTVGSSNLDPISLFLNLEANLFIRDREFAQKLGGQMDRLLREHCVEIGSSAVLGGNLWRQLLSVLVFHLLRRFPRWASPYPGIETETGVETATRVRSP